MFGFKIRNLLGGGIALDLGTVNTLAAMQNRGIVMREPSAVAVTADEKKQVVSVGIEAEAMLGRCPGGISVSYPMRDGVIADLHMAEAMLGYCIEKCIGHKPGPLGVKLALCLPLCTTSIEQRALIEAAKNSGAREVIFMNEACAAALGAGIAYDDPYGSMVVDIGGGTTDAAVIAMGGIAAFKSIRTGGTHIDEAVAEYVCREHGVMIGIKTAEQIKCTIGRAVVGGCEKMQIRGRSVETGLPKCIVVEQGEISHAIVPAVRRIVSAVKETLAETPPELAGDLYERGIWLTGGGAKLDGLADLISSETGVPAAVAECPEDCVVVGALRALELHDSDSELLRSRMVAEA